MPVLLQAEPVRARFVLLHRSIEEHLQSVMDTLSIGGCDRERLNLDCGEIACPTEER